MKLKKVTAGLLAGMMAMSLMACGSGESQNAEENTVTEETETAAEEKAEEEQGKKSSKQ